MVRASIIWDKKTVIKHRKRVGRKVYMYIILSNLNNEMEYVHSCDL